MHLSTYSESLLGLGTILFGSFLNTKLEFKQSSKTLWRQREEEKIDFIEARSPSAYTGLWTEL